MNNNFVELVFILDASGSMYSLTDDTIGSYNSLLEEQKNQDGECIVSTVIFNHNIKVVHDRVDIKNVAPLTKSDYQPGGCTALYDAVGSTIDNIGKKLSDTPEEDRPCKVMVVIVTDGLENASREYTSKDVKSRIEHQRDKYNWDFNFIGANIDVEEAAQDIGISTMDAMTYTASDIGTKSVYTSLSNSISELRTTGSYSKTTLDNSIQ